MKQDLKVRLAQPSDMRIIIAMIDEAAGWLRGKGTDQWASPFPNRKARDARVRRGLTGGKTWIAEEANEAVATISLLPWNRATERSTCPEWSSAAGPRDRKSEPD